ncbi:MAG: hypothetical protein IKZ59_07880 [Clostridia bacterium]|nr:hypothetical protein [Clostridia bacterium]
MDDLNRKLEEILSDPESMKKVRMMAESILGDEDGENEQDGEKDNGYSEESAPLGGDDLNRIMGILGKIGSAQNDNRANLLIALKPHLSERRREKVDSAVKLLKLIEALPLLKEAGILDFG